MGGGGEIEPQSATQKSHMLTSRPPSLLWGKISRHKNRNTVDLPNIPMVPPLPKSAGKNMH